MVEVDGKSVFLSGPMTGVLHYNAGAFADAHAVLKMMGAEDIFDPAQEWLREPNDAQREHEFYMRSCINELTRMDCHGEPCYDVLVALPGWKESEGSRTEVTVAEACGIEVCELGDVVQEECGECPFQGDCDEGHSDMGDFIDMLASILKGAFEDGDED